MKLIHPPTGARPAIINRTNNPVGMALGTVPEPAHRRGRMTHRRRAVGRVNAGIRWDIFPMRHLIPSVREISVFAALSVGAAALVTLFASATAHDLGLSFVAMPLFVFAAVLGLRRNWSRLAREVPDASAPNAVDVERA